MKWLLALSLLGFVLNVNAQVWSIPAKSGEAEFADIVYLETVYHRPNHSVNDTLAGTGFLLTKDSVVYLVTTKHQLQAAVEGKNQTQITGNLSVSGQFQKKMRMAAFSWLPQNKRSYIFSGDKEDLAIISFKSRKNRPILNHLLKLGCIPLPTDSLAINQNITKGDSCFIPGYFSFYGKDWLRHVQQGLGPYIIKKDNPNQSYLFLRFDTSSSLSGAPIFKNDKIIGMITHPDSLSTTASILNNPYKRAQTAVAIKADRIAKLIAQLQKQEENHTLKPTIENIHKKPSLLLQPKN